MKGSFLIAGLLVAAFASKVHATVWGPLEYRCTFDQLSTSQGKGRVTWASKGRLKNPYNRPFPKDDRFITSEWLVDALNTYEATGRVLYPVYSDLSPPNDIWRGPGAYGTPTAVYSESEISNLDATFKPAGVFNDGLCQAGCYVPTQKILFEEGEVAIATAQRLGRTDLLTLSADSTFEKIQLTNNPVLRYSRDQRPSDQDILTFQMVSGGQLSITPLHPLVTQDGAIKQAIDFVVGEHLVRKDGTLDEIISIDQVIRHVQVYNLKPVSTEPVSNILVAEGYLNGSGRFQSEYLEELNRIILRHNVPDELIPGHRASH